MPTVLALPKSRYASCRQRWTWRLEARWPQSIQCASCFLSFDQNGKWVGVNRNSLLLTLAADGNLFQGRVKSSNRNLDDNVLSTSTCPPAGKRILVQPFNQPSEPIGKEKPSVVNDSLGRRSRVPAADSMEIGLPSNNHWRIPTITYRG